MAEFGAHLTSTTVSNRPSFFEVLAQESLMSTLRPAMKHLIKDSGNLSSGLWHYRKRGIGIAAISISQGLSVSIFFLQFLEWWYMSQDNQSRLAVTALPIPKPPKVEQKEKSAVPEDVSLCPLCHKHRTNDTALSTSGYVFCYPCIYS
ncbi:peroxisome assembly protein 12-like [Asterias rubens]|uniref:peroxisome assembly protein 12-like n=1 Tax=Asterias rubens TaxID=7604 RepID=UPI001455211A|nr:peroxisome assembly protein 12-like [Asterias rubens]